MSRDARIGDAATGTCEARAERSGKDGAGGDVSDMGMSLNSRLGRLCRRVSIDGDFDGSRRRNRTAADLGDAAED